MASASAAVNHRRGGFRGRLGELEGRALYIKLRCWGRGGGEEELRSLNIRGRGGLQGAVNVMKL